MRYSHRKKYISEREREGQKKTGGTINSYISIISCAALMSPMYRWCEAEWILSIPSFCASGVPSKFIFETCSVWGSLHRSLLSQYSSSWLSWKLWNTLEWEREKNCTLSLFQPIRLRTRRLWPFFFFLLFFPSIFIFYVVEDSCIAYLPEELMTRQ